MTQGGDYDLPAIRQLCCAVLKRAFLDVTFDDDGGEYPARRWLESGDGRGWLVALGLPADLLARLDSTPPDRRPALLRRRRRRQKQDG